MIERERYADYRKYTFLGRTLILALRGASAHAFDMLEEELSLAIFQTAFDPAAVNQRLAAVKQAAQERQEALARDARLLARVASYGADTDADDARVHQDVFARRLEERAKTLKKTEVVADAPSSGRTR